MLWYLGLTCALCMGGHIAAGQRGEKNILYFGVIIFALGYAGGKQQVNKIKLD